jgi:hypothetical protein
MDSTGAERQRRYMAKLKAAAAKGGVSDAPSVDPLLTATQQELAKARAEIARLRAVSNATVSDAALAKAQAELRYERNEVALLRSEVEKLKAKIVKPVKPPLDPESEAARQIAALKKKTLQQEADKWLRELRTQVPSAMRGKVAKALTEHTTSPENRLNALQAWNGLGLNNIGK